MSDVQERIDKLEVLRKRGTDGEKVAAEKLLTKLFKKYGLKPSLEAEEEEQNYKRAELNPFEKNMFTYIVYKYKGVTFTWTVGNNFKSVCNYACTPSNRKRILDEYNRHKSTLDEYLTAMTEQYVAQNKLCKFKEVDKEEFNSNQEMTDIEVMMGLMNMKTNEETEVLIEATKKIESLDGK